MKLNRRNFVGGTTAGVACLVRTAPPAGAQEQQAPSIETLQRDVSREITQILKTADQEHVPISEPIPAAGGAPPDPLLLADVIEKALQKNTPESLLLARRTGVLLSALTTLQHEASDQPGANEPVPAAKMTFPELKGYYTNLCRTAGIQDPRQAEISRIASKIIQNKDRYIEVQQRTNVPWFIIGALHYREEANLNFLGHLHNGDNLLMLTVHVPPNRPKQRPWPPQGENLRQIWSYSAVDALNEFPKLKPWSLQKVCYAMEEYNGFGCYYHHINTPYLWNYTNQYSQGGYIGDGDYRSDYEFKASRPIYDNTRPEAGSRGLGTGIDARNMRFERASAWGQSK